MDPDTFSNAASRHLSVPDGMDPPEHTEYRRMIEQYFRPERVDAFEPQCREIAAKRLQSLLERDELEFIGDFAHWFAVRIQSASLGWPLEMCETLRLWTQKNHQATFAQDRPAMAEIAKEFEGYVHQLLQIRRAAGAQASDDITGSLLRQQVQGRPLRDEEIVSIVRNWTVGEVGTISAALGILVHYLAQHPDLQQQLRAQPSLLPAAIEEILRIYGPLVSNRRITTRPVEIGGRKIAAGERLSLIWISANRDARVFEEPEAYRPDRDQTANLLYGAGIHVCPGAPLARMEMRVAMEEILGHTTRIDPIPETPPTGAVYPGSGFATLPLRVR
ncbi:cytochrome P450 [Candidatus Accumulibacter sp. ACC003]|uniref:cytochrome P450 n=1 Tax=Candidatus Accumulibacter sp. ACC003 TaxID=2823334 RepID=UPI00344B7CBE